MCQKYNLCFNYSYDSLIIKFFMHLQSKTLGLVIISILIFSSLNVPKADAVQIKPPTATSWYVNTISGDTDQSLYDWMSARGREAGERDLALPGTQSSVVIFHFGRPEFNGSTYGASGYGRFLSTDIITEAIKRYAISYYFATSSDVLSQVRMAVGTSNFGPYVSYGHGQAWAQMVKNIGVWLQSTVYGSQAQVRAANDIEMDFSSSSVANSWINGYAASWSFPYYLYDFGDAAGCYQLGTTATPGPCNNGWTQRDVRYVSWGAAPSYPFPEIYTTNSSQAKQWQQISLYSYLAFGGRLGVLGPLSQSQACVQRGGCFGTDNTPDQAWTQLWNELNSDTLTVQDLLYSSDIKWRQ